MIDLIKTTFREFLDDDSPRLAAALSYYTVFSLPPLLILIMMIAGLIWDPEQIQSLLVQHSGGVLGSEGAGQIRSMIEHADRPGSGGPLVTLLSIAGLIFGATGAFAQLQAALNKAWEVEKDPDSGIRGLVMKRVLSFGMILVIMFLLLVSLVLSVVLSAAGSAIAGALPSGFGEPLLRVFDIGLSLLVITLLVMAMYRVLPDARVAWKDVWFGSLVTAALFVVGKFLLALYISNTDPGSAFGAAGSLAIILVWIYYSAMILFLGAEFTQVYAKRRGRRIEPAAGAVRVADFEGTGG